MKNAITIILSWAFSLCLFADTFQWESVQINDTSYISFQQFSEFYKLSEKERIGDQITLENKRAQLKFTIGSQETAINGVKIFLSKPILEKDQSPHLSQLDLSSLIDPILRPRSISNAKKFNTIILDPGHGGSDQGAANLEAQYTLAIVKKTRTLLTKKGFRVVLTRSGDTHIPLEERVNIANQETNAILISLHFNSGDKSAHGMETYIISAKEPHATGAASAALATAIHSRCLMYFNNKQHGHELGIEDRGIRHAKFSLLKDSQHPAILIEAGFLTNREEAAKIQTEAYQNTLAQSLVRGIEVYRTSLRK